MYQHSIRVYTKTGKHVEHYTLSLTDKTMHTITGKLHYLTITLNDKQEI